MTVARRMSFPVRAGMLLLLCYGMGITALGITSLFGTGPLYLMAFVLPAVFLFGRRSGIGALLLSIPPLLWATGRVLVDPDFTSSAQAILPTSTVPIAPGVLPTPLVGTIDSQRAQMLTKRLLHTVQQQRTTTVLLDITGVATVDAGVAGALVATAQSLQLLGCAVVLTGISPQVAEIFIQCGMHLNGIRTAHSPQEVLYTTRAFSRI